MYFAVLRRAIVMAGVALALTSAAQTKLSPEYARWFVLPKPQLRAEDTEPAGPGSDLQHSGAGLSSAPADVDHSQKDFQLYYYKPQGFELTRLAHVPDDPLDWAFASVFEPEVFHVGRRTTVSCSILTAIKRKNPFCLLNPIFLVVTW